MWCVPELNEEYIEKMEDVLGTYEQAYNPQEPVVCVHEKPVSLHAEVRPRSSAMPGQEARRDSEYERRGTANVFCAVEPKVGRHFTYATPDPFRLRVRSGGFRSGNAVPGGANHPSGAGQSQHPPPQVADGSARPGSRQQSLGSIYNPLHAHSRKLVESGRNRDRPLFTAMPRNPTNPRPEDPPQGGLRMESRNEPPAYTD